MQGTTEELKKLVDELLEGTHSLATQFPEKPGPTIKCQPTRTSQGVLFLIIKMPIGKKDELKAEKVLDFLKSK